MKQDIKIYGRTVAEQLPLVFERPSPFELMSPLEMFQSANEELLRKLTEDRRFEAKPNTFGARQLGEYICMWANTVPNGGLIAVGIRKDKSFEGCANVGTRKINDIEKSGSIYSPDAKYISKRITIHRDKDQGLDFVILIYVEYNKSRVVRTSEGKVFIRIGDEKREVKHPDELRRMQEDKGEISFEAELSRLKYPDDFDMVAIGEFAERVKVQRGLEQRHSTEDILELRCLGSREGSIFRANIACVLLFALQPRKIVPGCRIHFLRFEGEQEHTGEKWNAVKDEFIEGTIPYQIQNAERILRSQLRNFSRLGPGAKFYTSPEYPDQAWYEAIVNACVHRCYGNGLSNMNIEIRMYDDRLVIESPGPFPPFVTPKNIYDVHFPRNPYLMDAMYYLDLVKCAHEGTRRIRDTMKRMDLPAPEFKQDEIGHAVVRVTLRNNIKQRKVWVDTNIAELIGAQIASQLDEHEKRCLNCVAEHKEISVSDAQRLTGRTWPAAKKLLMGLVRKKILDHEHRKDLERDPQARFVMCKYPRLRSS